jgi:hypothetical protein
VVAATEGGGGDGSRGEEGEEGRAVGRRVWAGDGADLRLLDRLFDVISRPNVNQDRLHLRWAAVRGWGGEAAER